MKKIVSLFAALLCAGLVLVGCSGCSNSSGGGGSSSGGGGNASVPIEAGWYKYTVGNKEPPSVTFFYFSSGGNVERAGNDSTEYTDSILNSFKQTTSYATCKQGADMYSYITLQRCGAPSWAGSSGGGSNPLADALNVTTTPSCSYTTDKAVQLSSGSTTLYYSCSYQCVISAQNVLTVSDAFKNESFQATVRAWTDPSMSGAPTYTTFVDYTP